MEHECCDSFCLECLADEKILYDDDSYPAYFGRFCWNDNCPNQYRRGEIWCPYYCYYCKRDFCSACILFAENHYDGGLFDDDYEFGDCRKKWTRISIFQPTNDDDDDSDDWVEVNWRYICPKCID